MPCPRRTNVGFAGWPRVAPSGRTRRRPRPGCRGFRCPDLEKMGDMFAIFILPTKKNIRTKDIYNCTLSLLYKISDVKTEIEIKY